MARPVTVRSAGARCDGCLNELGAVELATVEMGTPNILRAELRLPTKALGIYLSEQCLDDVIDVVAFELRSRWLKCLACDNHSGGF